MGGVMIDPVQGGKALALVIAAGLSTTFGAAIIFNSKLVMLTNKLFLAGALGFSSGVMMYVSFIEIFVKSHSAFESSGHSPADAYLFATLSFFGGILLMKIVDHIVHAVAGHADPLDMDISNNEETPKQETPEVSCSEVELRAQVLKDRKAPHATIMNKLAELSLECGESGESKPQETERSQAALQRMGLMTAIAIGIHNFPEGLATFVAALDGMSVGGSLAVAIAIHNIPEGLCVAIPIYYSTGNRCRAFWYAFISGVSEPVGALLGWAILYRVMDETAYGIIFGIVAGMMVNIVIHEILPTAHRYDPKDKVTSNSAFVGMGIMALSLIMFST